MKVRYFQAPILTSKGGKTMKKKVGVLNSPQDFENLHFYFFGQFEVGDIISIFPDRNCQISKVEIY